MGGCSRDGQGYPAGRCPRSADEGPRCPSGGQLEPGRREGRVTRRAEDHPGPGHGRRRQRGRVGLHGDVKLPGASRAFASPKSSTFTDDRGVASRLPGADNRCAERQDPERDGDSRYEWPPPVADEQAHLRPPSSWRDSTHSIPGSVRRAAPKCVGCCHAWTLASHDPARRSVSARAGSRSTISDIGSSGGALESACPGTR